MPSPSAQPVRASIDTGNVGICDVMVIGVQTDTVEQYATASGALTQIAKVSKGELKLEFESETAYYDDKKAMTVYNFKGGSLSIEGLNPSPEMKAKIFGQALAGGMNTINSNDKGEKLAIAFRSKNSNGTYDFYQFYSVQWDGKLEKKFETQGEKAKIQDMKITFEISPRLKDDNIGINCDESFLISSNANAKAAITSWFEGIKEPVAEDA